MSSSKSTEIPLPAHTPIVRAKRMRIDTSPNSKAQILHRGRGARPAATQQPRRGCWPSFPGAYRSLRALSAPLSCAHTSWSLCGAPQGGTDSVPPTSWEWWSLSVPWASLLACLFSGWTLLTHKYIFLLQPFNCAVHSAMAWIACLYAGQSHFGQVPLSPSCISKPCDYALISLSLIFCI